MKDGKMTCPKCGMEYDALNEAAVKAIGGLCAACWCEQTEETGKYKKQSYNNEFNFSINSFKK